MKKTNSFRKPLFPVVLISLILLSSCSLPADPEDGAMYEQSQIQDFLVENDTLDFELKTSGLYYLDYNPGPGLQAETHDTAYVFYSMHFMNGYVFQTNYNTNDTLIVPVNEGDLLPGLDEIIIYMKEGGISLGILPSKLAFGEQGNAYISPFTPFLAQVELVKLVKYSD